MIAVDAVLAVQTRTSVTRALPTPRTLARLYFAVQALAGAAWWVGVFTIPFVKVTTLGSLDAVPVAVLDIPLFVVTSALAAVLAERPARAAAAVATAWTVLVTVLLAVYATFTGEAGWGVLLMGAASAGSIGALCLLWLGRIPTEWALAGPFAFRPARPGRGPLPHILVTLAQIAVFWGLFLGVIPVIVSTLEARWGLAVGFPAALSSVGWMLFLAASALGVWSALAMNVRGDGTPLPAAMANRLVIVGPYRYVRNPMALSGIVQGAAVGLMLSSWLVVLYAVLGSLLWNFAIRPLEEADLEARFGDEFRRYRDTVRCWLPRLRGRAVTARGVDSVGGMSSRERR